MNHQLIAHEIVNYYDKRGIGNTNAMLDGVREADCLVVTPTYRDFTHLLVERDKAMTFLHIESEKLRGEKRPMIVDHVSIKMLLEGLLRDIYSRDAEIAELKREAREAVRLAKV